MSKGNKEQKHGAAPDGGCPKSASFGAYTTAISRRGGQVEVVSPLLFQTSEKVPQNDRFQGIEETRDVLYYLREASLRQALRSMPWSYPPTAQKNGKRRRRLRYQPFPPGDPGGSFSFPGDEWGAGLGLD